jgi:streptogramin lyase
VLRRYSTPSPGGAHAGRTPRVVDRTTSVFLVPAAQAAPVGGLKQYKVPNANSDPRAITLGSDGNMWFTEGTEFTGAPAKIGRITPAGAVTEFPVECNFCILTDVAQGPSNILYFTSNNAELGRFDITTGALVLPNIQMPNSSALAGRLAIAGNDVWITDFNNDVIWRYRIGTGVFTAFSDPGADPSDVAVDAAGTVWIAEPSTQAIGRLDPTSGVITHTTTTSTPLGVAVAADGQVWFTARFTPQAVGRLDPTNNAVTEFPLVNVGPEFIAPAPDGSMWFTQETGATSPGSPTPVSSPKARLSRAAGRSTSPSTLVATPGTP